MSPPKPRGAVSWARKNHYKLNLEKYALDTFLRGLFLRHYYWGLRLFPFTMGKLGGRVLGRWTGRNFCPWRVP